MLVFRPEKGIRAMKKVIIYLGVIAIISASNPSSAANIINKYKITYSGEIVGSTTLDTTGVFGSPNTLLRGAQYRASFILTTPLIGGTNIVGDNIREYRNGAYYTTIPNTNFLSAELTINGITRSFGHRSYSGGAITYVNRFGALSNAHDTFGHSIFDVYQDSNYFTYSYLASSVRSYSRNITDGLDFTTPVNYNYQIGDETDNGSFAIFELDKTTNQVIARANGGFGNSSLQIEQISAVPEPSSWALMIIGFGLVGGAIRILGRKIRATNRLFPDSTKACR
jgi:hypothetical protein